MSDDRWTWTPDGSGGTPPPLTGGALPPALGGPLPPVTGGPVPPATSGPLPPVVGGTVLTPLTELPVWGYYEPPRRRRTGLWVGVGLGVVALVGAGVAGWVLVGQKMIPARSPQAAVDRLIDGIAGKDALAVYGALSPAEANLFEQGFSLFDEDALPTPEPSAAAVWQDVLDGLTIEVEDLELTPTSLDDGLAKVAVTGGTVRIDGDPAAIADAYFDAVESSVAGMADQLPEGIDLTAQRAEMAAQLDEFFPFEASPARDWQVDGAVPYLVAVHEGRGWYVSPLMTIGEYMLADTGVARGEMPPSADGAGHETPEEAAEAATHALVDLLQGDHAALTDELPLAERRFAAVYLEPLLADGWTDDQAVDRATVTAAEFDVAETGEERALLTPTDLTVEIESAGEIGTLTFDGDCLALTPPNPDEGFAMCLSDVPLYQAMGLDSMRYVAVREGGSWHVSVIATFADQAARTVQALVRMADDGTLYDERWWLDQMSGIDGWGPEFTDAAGPVYYGDDPELDGLADACLAGDLAACDSLFFAAPGLGSGADPEEYSVIAGTCGFAVDVWMGGACFQPGLRG